MASVNTQFSIAVHILVALGISGEEMTSSKLAQSVNAYPTFVRRILSKLSKAGLLKTTTGKSGCCCLKKKTSEINLLDVYEAVEAPKVFAIHEYPSRKTCSVSKGIKFCMENVLDKTQKAMESSLKKTTLLDVIKDLSKK
jgi:Rrf2 family protein